MAKLHFFGTILTLMSFSDSMSAQQYNIDEGYLTDFYYEGFNENTLIFSAPFLRKSSDARSGGLGEIGIASSPDANSMHYNASKIAFSDSDFGFTISHAPMFRQLGIHDQMINSIGAYKKIRNNNAIGLEVKFSSAGKYFSHNLGPYFSGKNIPTESLVSLAIAKKWTNNFSGAFTLKFIHSNIGYSYAIFFDQGRNLEPGRALATDFSVTYEAPLTIDNNTSKLRFGLAITNLGTPISYSNDLSREYLPANIGFGVAWTTRLNTENNISFLADINKLLVPSPQSCTGLICSHAVQPSVVRTALFSFGDAQGGISEELSEIYYSVGLEYDYLKKIFLRTGYLYEHPEKGNRQSLALGIGYAYRNIVADFSLQIPLIETETIDNRYRFSISYSWSKTKKSE